MRLLVLAAFLVGCTDDHLVYVSRFTEPACALSQITCPDSKAGDPCANAGVPSAAGGCCSEWIPCAEGLSCVPQGQVYPGSKGVCVAAS